MGESGPIKNVVSSLKSLRDQYQDELHVVPQYAAFLQVEQSTAKVAEALGLTPGSSGLSVAHDVMSALETAQYKFKQHLESVPEYRVLVAIDNLISTLSVETETAEAAPAAAPAEAAPAEATASAPAAETTTAAANETAHADVETVPDYGAKVEAALQDDTPMAASAEMSPDTQPAAAVASSSADVSAETVDVPAAAAASQAFAFAADAPAPETVAATAEPNYADHAAQGVAAAEPAAYQEPLAAPPAAHDMAESAERAA
jgi:hypothetical protein